MLIISLVISCLALIVAICSLIVVKRKDSNKVIVKETKTIVDNPFSYDEKKRCYNLKGDLKVDGYITCLSKE